MQIVIHAGGIPFNGNTINKRSLGGSESAAYYVSKELAARGHNVVVFTECKEEDEGVFDGVNYLNMGERTPQQPLGNTWHWYCENTPHDVNIVQRQPGSFMFHIQSKINLWWAHDIALKRNNPFFMAQVWQTDRVLPVSHWFKDQICNAWVCNPEVVTPVHNGVDYSLYKNRELKDNSVPQDQITLLYQSRPERGLNNLLMEGGIMEQLVEKAPHVKLIICGYEHPVPHLEQFYSYLKQRAEELPNVEHRGGVTKEELARIQCEEADVWCYPTEFEEVSCITAMECMAAGMYLLTTNTAALPETIGDSYENQTRFNYGDDIVDRFVTWLTKFDGKFRRRPAYDYTWGRVADEFESVIVDCFNKYTSDPDAVARHLLRNSDIVALENLPGGIPTVVEDELDELYRPWMYDVEEYGKHYADGTEAMYDAPGWQYEGPDFVKHPRFNEVAKFIDEKKPKKVIDYGCAHGMFCNYLAAAYPDIQFVGIDVSPAAIQVAKNKANELELKNIEFIEDDWLTPGEEEYFDCDLIILGEILEHVPDPVDFMETVRHVVGFADVIVTTPIGPWESLSYQKDYPKRFHLHHFERSDLSDMFGHLAGFQVNCLPNGHTTEGELIGWYISKFHIDTAGEGVRPINYERKLSQIRPRQTVSLCMIVKDADSTLMKTLRSVEPYVDEMIIGVDESTTDKTVNVIREFWSECNAKHRSPRMHIEYFNIPSPTEIGFDAARNLTLEKANKHWIMWCDSDEEFVGGPRVVKYLRQNGWNGYGIPQHHFSTEPLGVLSTDFPVRIFRNSPDVRFLGVVHEHPENINLQNEGVGFAYVVNELHFSHTGYTTEEIRRNRFMRNIRLMARDRKENPDRLLGKFLWIRDLALMCRFELEQTNGYVTPGMVDKARQGIKLWEETITKSSTHPQVRRMVKDHLEFYDTLVKILGEGFDFRINFGSGNGVDANPLNPNTELHAKFANRKHLDLFLSVVIDEEVKDYGTKYH